MEKWKTTERSGEMLIVINQNIVFRPLKKKTFSLFLKSLEILCIVFSLNSNFCLFFFQNAQTFSFPDLKIEAKQVCVLIEQENI